MSRGGSAGMSGANNIPLGRPGGQGGQLAQAASSLGGISLLNPSYLKAEGLGQILMKERPRPPLQAVGVNLDLL